MSPCVFVSGGPTCPVGLFFFLESHTVLLTVTLFIFICLFIYFWLRWVFVVAHRLSLVVASGRYSLLQ